MKIRNRIDNNYLKHYSVFTFFETYICPPKSFELMVITNEPTHTTTNTSANCGPPSLLLSATL